MPRRAPLVPILLLVALSLAALAPLGANTPLMPISEIRPGMVGIGRTVFSGTRVEEFRAFYAEWGSWVILIKGVRPIPYKLVTIVSGFAGYSFPMFVLLSAITRGARFTLWATLLYLYIEVQRRLQNPDLAFARARQIFALGFLTSFGIGLVLTGLLGPFMASRNWSDSGADVAALRQSVGPLVGQLPEILGMGPFLVFPGAVLFMSFLAFFLGTFLQLMWEDLPITEPL